MRLGFRVMEALYNWQSRRLASRIERDLRTLYPDVRVRAQALGAMCGNESHIVCMNDGEVLEVVHVLPADDGFFVAIDPVEVVTPVEGEDDE